MIFSNTLKIKSALQRDPTELCRRRAQGRWNPRASADITHSRDCRSLVQHGPPRSLAATLWACSFPPLYSTTFFQILTGLPKRGFFIKISNTGRVKAHEVLDAMVRERAGQPDQHSPSKGSLLSPSWLMMYLECQFWFPGLLWHGLLRLPVGSKILQDQIPGRWQAQNNILKRLEVLLHTSYSQQSWHGWTLYMKRGGRGLYTVWNSHCVSAA